VSRWYVTFSVRLSHKRAGQKSAENATMGLKFFEVAIKVLFVPIQLNIHQTELQL
jgi:hypothetical protein